MKLSPLNIKKQEFNKSMRGFDTDEVKAFLAKLSEDVDELQKENDKLKFELEEANEKLKEYRKIEKNLQETLLKAQESTNRVAESAKRQTSLMVKEAEIKASQVIEKARESANEIRNSVNHLREERDLIIAKLKSIVNTQAHLLELKVETPQEKIKETKAIKIPVHERKIDIDIENVVNKLL